MSWVTCCWQQDDVIEVGGDHGEDIRRYQVAEKTRNVELLITLLDSNKTVKIDFKHPWAFRPQTVGSLAAMKLCTLCADEASTRGDVKAKVRKLGGLRPLVKFLSQTQDRIHAGLLVLSYVSVDEDIRPNIDNCTQIYDLGALPILVDLIKTLPVQGARLAAVDIATMLCFTNSAYRLQFSKQGGIANIINLLEYKPNFTHDEEEQMLTFMDYLHDILNDASSNQKNNNNIIQAAKKVGLIQKLKAFQESQNHDMKEIIQKILNVKIITSHSTNRRR